MIHIFNHINQEGSLEMALVDKNEMMELGKYFINGIAYGGTDPVKDYILKDKPSIKQKLETKATLLKCLNTAKKMKAKGADRNDMLDALTYAYILLETEEHTMDLGRAKADFRMDEIQRKYT